MKQIWPNYSYSPTTNVLTLTGLNIDRDQLLLVSAPERGRIMYNFADSTVTASAFTAGANTGLTLVASTAGLTTTAALVIYYDDQLQSTAITISSLPAISGTVTANLGSIGGYRGAVELVNFNDDDGEYYALAVSNGGAPYIPTRIVGGSVTIGNTVTIAGTVTANPTGTQTITGSVTASISGTVPISISSVTVGVLPDLTISTDFADVGTAIAAGITNYGSIPVSIVAGTVTANTFAVQGTAVTTSNFTSTTASTVLASFNATREVLTIFNEGAGNLHIAPGATCTTIAYQVRLSAGDYYEVPNHQTTITHSAVFATAGTARVTQVT